MRKLILIAILFIAFSGCKNGIKFPPPVTKEDAETINAKILPPPVVKQEVNVDAAIGNVNDKSVADGNETTASAVTDTSKKIVKEGTIEFEAENLMATRKRIITALKRYGGYIDEDNQSTNGAEDRKEYNLKIRIPAKNFDFVIDSISSTADKIDSKNISITDVTTRYIDIKTRLDNKKILEKRYLELLSRSSKIADLLEIENKLSEIRSDIESTQGQLNYLNKQVAYSSLDITFYTKQTAQVNSGDDIGYKIKKALARGWHRLQNIFFGLIALWPYLLLLGIAYWLVKVWMKRRKAVSDE